MLARLCSRGAPGWVLLALVPFMLVIHVCRLPNGPSDSIRAPFEMLSLLTNGSTAEHSLARFWEDLLEDLVRAKPFANVIKTYGSPLQDDMDPNVGYEEGRGRTDIIHISESDRAGLKSAHESFVDALVTLATQLPYKKRSRGVVVTAGGKYLGMAVTSLLMLRRTGSKLPMELFLAAADYNSHICDEQLPKLNAKCLVMEGVFARTPLMPKLEKYQFKVFSILFSNFQEILFLDADAFPIHNPDYLFSNESFLSHGFVAWPGHWKPTVSPIFYDISGLEVPPINKRLTSESGVMLYDKARHAESLLLATYYNFYGPDYFYPLLSQNGHGQGDKETFLHSAAVLNKPFYDVKTNITFLGRWLNGTFETAGMKQADPAEDYAIHVSDGQSQWVGQKGLRGPQGPRTLFIQHNPVKIDLRNMDDTINHLLEKDEFGKLVRLWGHDNRLMESSGYDVEMTLWDEIIEANCRSSWSEDCDKLREYYTKVFNA